MGTPQKDFMSRSSGVLAKSHRRLVKCIKIITRIIWIEDIIMRIMDVNRYDFILFSYTSLSKIDVLIITYISKCYSSLIPKLL